MCVDIQIYERVGSTDGEFSNTKVSLTIFFFLLRYQRKRGERGREIEKDWRSF